MDNTSTQQLKQSLKRNHGQKPAPKPSTVEFIRQFARVYTFEPRLSPSLGNIIAN